MKTLAELDAYAERLKWYEEFIVNNSTPKAVINKPKPRMIEVPHNPATMEVFIRGHWISVREARLRGYKFE